MKFESIVLYDLDITVGPTELLKKISGAERADIKSATLQTLEKVKNTWNPGIIYRWLPFAKDVGDRNGTVIDLEGNPIKIDFGFSSQFVDKASYVLVAVYSAGKVLEKTGQNAAREKQPLIAYIIDIISLLVLEKTGELVKQIAERKAKELGWGVGPFLSPGSVHGWDLKEQLKLCSLLPLERAGLSIREDAVLRPFKSLSCLIGIGSDYDSESVGSTCLVCSRNSDCQMK